MFNIGPGELVAILVVALIVLGPNRLPEAVRTAGRVVGELRRISSGFQEELRNALDDSDVIDAVEPVSSSNEGTEVVDSSAAALVEAAASAASPVGSEEMVDDDLDDFGDAPDAPALPAAGSTDEPEPEPEIVAATPGADALGTPVDDDVSDDDDGDSDGRGSLDHIEALEALDPARGAEAEIAAPAEPVVDVGDAGGPASSDTTTLEPGNGADADAGADDRRAAS